MSIYDKNEYRPDFVSPPGDTLLEVIGELGMTQAELALRTGREKKTISQIIKGKAPISPETSIMLEKVLGIPASFWNKRESQYQESQARVREREKLDKEIEWLKKIPFKEMIKFGWIEKYNDLTNQLREVLSFFGVASPESYFAVQSLTNYRKSATLSSHPNAVRAWLRKGEIDAQEINTNTYNASQFKSTLKHIRDMTVDIPEIFIPEIKKICSKCGVAVVFTPELKQTRISGAARWLNPNKALIQLSLRYKTDDHFWFTFYHEAGHILLHGKRDKFLDVPDGTETVKEEEANKFSSRYLIPDKDFNILVNGNYKRKEFIRNFAKSIGLAPGIVVGRLQYEKLIPMSHMNDLKRKLEWTKIQQILR